MHALQSSFKRLGSSLVGGGFDTNRACEKIGTKMQLLALIATATVAVHRIIQVHRPQCLTSQLGLT